MTDGLEEEKILELAIDAGSAWIACWILWRVNLSIDEWHGVRERLGDGFEKIFSAVNIDPEEGFKVFTEHIESGLRVIDIHGGSFVKAPLWRLVEEGTLPKPPPSWTFNPRD